MWPICSRPTFASKLRPTCTYRSCVIFMHRPTKNPISKHALVLISLVISIISLRCSLLTSECRIQIIFKCIFISASLHISIGLFMCAWMYCAAENGQVVCVGSDLRYINFPLSLRSITLHGFRTRQIVLKLNYTRSRESNLKATPIVNKQLTMRTSS